MLLTLATLVACGGCSAYTRDIDEYDDTELGADEGEGAGPAEGEGEGPAEGEGEGPMEGEGEGEGPAEGEGEGPAEGEGEGPAEGEGEGPAEGEGEGPAEGEGEGPAEGEGEGPAEGEGEGEPPVLGEAVCDGNDDDGDGEIDELERAVPESVTVTFSGTSEIDPEATFRIQDRDGQEIPLPEGGLAGASVVVAGNLVRFVVEGPNRQGVYGFDVVAARDHVDVELPLPELPEADHYPDGGAQWTYEIGDNLGSGVACGSADGECEQGWIRCVRGQVICDQEVPPADERCDTLDNDCDGEIDEALDLVDAPDCEQQLGVCAGAKRRCVEGAYEPTCNSLDYGLDYEPDETRCDCVDNDCDGIVDGTGEALIGCTFDDLAPHGAGQDCTVQASGPATSGAYSFGSLTVPPGVAVSVPPLPADEACGYPGKGRCMKPGGCLTVSAQRLDIAGSLGADAEFRGIGGGDCSGASGGDVLLIADEVTVAGRVHANGSRGSHFSMAGAGGGAGGSVRIRARQTRVLDGGVIETRGARASPNGGGVGADWGDPGGGAGGAGGQSGGAGAGGAGNGAAGIGTENRPLELTGHVSIDAGGQVRSRTGLDAVNGVIVLGGQAALHRELPIGHDMRLFGLAIRLVDADGGAVADAVVRLVQQGGDVTHELGATDIHGWLIAAPDDPVFLSDLTHTLELAAVQDGRALISYGDPDTEVACTLERPIEGGVVSFPALRDCPADDE